MASLRATCTAFARLHVSLIDLGDVTGRRYGGIGLSIAQPVASVTAVRARRDTFIYAGRTRHHAPRVSAALARLRARVPLGPVRLCIQQMTLPHVGLGSSTSVILASLKAAVAASKIHCSSAELQEASGRGGTSGVGVHAFFHGGCVCDLGHPASKGESYRPSRAAHDFTVPPMLCRHPIPREWRVALILLKGRHYAGRAEANFFAKNTPVPKNEVLRVLSSVYHGVVPAVIQGNIDASSAALIEIHQNGFKRAELMGQTENIRSAYTDLSCLQNVAVGLSSMGPLLYSIFDSRDEKARYLVGKIAKAYKSKLFVETKFRNRGFDLKVS